MEPEAKPEVHRQQKSWNSNEDSTYLPTNNQLGTNSDAPRQGAMSRQTDNLPLQKQLVAREYTEQRKKTVEPEVLTRPQV